MSATRCRSSPDCMLDDHSATPFGVFRDVQRGDYGQMVGAQLAAASEKKGPGDLSALLRSNGTWHVGG